MRAGDRRRARDAKRAAGQLAHRAPDGSPEALRGRTIRYTIRLRASAPVTLSAGSVYVHDDARLSAAPLTAAGPEWRTISVDHTVSPRASRLEVWLRLVNGHGSIHPVGARLFFDAAVDLRE